MNEEGFLCVEKAKRAGNGYSVLGEITVQEIAEKFGVRAGTINFYTNLGILQECRRHGNKRFYKLDFVRERLTKVRELKVKGYSLRAIRSVLNDAAKM